MLRERALDLAGEEVLDLARKESVVIAKGPLDLVCCICLLSLLPSPSSTSVRDLGLLQEIHLLQICFRFAASLF